MSTFKEELITLINKHSQENGSDTPDFLLGEYLIGCLNNFDAIVAKRDQWYFDDSDKPLSPVIEFVKPPDIDKETDDNIKEFIDEMKTIPDVQEKVVKKREKALPVDNTLSDELIKSKIMLIYDYINRRFKSSMSDFNTAGTRQWVVDKFIDVLTVYNVRQYIRYISCDENNNSPEVIDNRQLVVDMGYSMHIGTMDYMKLHLTFPNKE